VGVEDVEYAPDVVLAVTVEASPTNQARKHQGDGRRIWLRGTDMFEELAHVLCGRIGVTNVKLDHLPILNRCSDGEGAGVGIKAKEIADQELAWLVVLKLWVHHEADVECTLSQALIGQRLSLIHISEPTRPY